MPLAVLDPQLLSRKAKLCYMTSSSFLPGLPVIHQTGQTGQVFKHSFLSCHKLLLVLFAQQNPHNPREFSYFLVLAGPEIKAPI